MKISLKLIGQDEETLFKNAVILSIILHFAIWGGFYLRNFFAGGNEIPLIEIDLTKPFRIGGNPLLKPGGGTSLKARIPETVAKPAEAKPAAVPEPEKKTPPKDWVLPGPNTKELEKPVPPAGASENKTAVGDPTGTEEGYPGTGGGWGGGEGEGGGIPLSRFPQLLNKSEILRMLRKLYPPVERQAGREGDVVVDIHISVDGQVTAVDIVGSASEDFDRVAQIVAKKMRFSPAMMKTTPVAVKIRQPIVFRLED